MNPDLDSLGAMTPRALFGALRIRHWVAIVTFLAGFGGLCFRAGVYWNSHSDVAQVGGGAEVDAFQLTVESARSYPVLSGDLLVALEPGSTNEDRLDMRPVVGWSDSPRGPFVREEGHNGPRYSPRLRTYIKLLNGDIWSVSVLAVHEHSIDVEFVKFQE